MINLNKEILSKLNIEYTFIITDAGNEFCKPVSISKNTWTLEVQNPDISKLETAELNIKYLDKLLKFKGKIHRKKNPKLISIDIESNENFDYSELKARIKELKTQMQNWSRRTEERYRVGIEKSELFGLKQPEQIVLDNNGIEVPCVVYDVSFSGIKVIAQDTDALAINNKVSLLLKTKTDSVVLKGIIMFKDEKVSKTSLKTHFAILSIKLKDNDLTYQSMVDAYSKLQE